MSSIIEEDVAFGLENYGDSEDEIAGKVVDALRAVGMDGFGQRSPHHLSGGQKQRIALAGVLAMNPAILVFDEVTSMLDPAGRREILDVIHDLHKRERRTVVMITHTIEDAVLADRVCLLEGGRVWRTERRGTSCLMRCY